MTRRFSPFIRRRVVVRSHGILGARPKVGAGDQNAHHCQERKRSLDLQSVDLSTIAAGAPSLPMNGVWRTIRSYILWQHERGTLHYDIMVTLILIFVFFSPRVINFNDKPVPRDPHLTDVVVTPDAQGNLVYQISASAITPGDDQSVRSQLLRIIQPISGEVTIVNCEPVGDGKGHVLTYKVLVKR
jgi:hypothetical protein